MGKAQPSAFDEKSAFDCFALFLRIKRGLLYPLNASKKIKSGFFIES
jgi:hypothetical protein